MPIALEIDAKDVSALLAEYPKQVPYAMAAVLNNVMFAARADVIASLSKNFTIAPSRLPFMQRLIRVKKATKQRMVAEMGTTLDEVGKSEKDRSYLLGRHELGGVRTMDPSHPFAIPTDEIRGGATDLPPRNLYPSALRIFGSRTADGILPAMRHVTKRGKVQIKGKRRTFVIDARLTADPNAWGIYQRTGPGKKDIRMIWAFRTKITLPPRLNFYRNVDLVVMTRWLPIVDETLAHVVSTARSKG